MNKVVNFGCRLNNFEGKKIEELLPSSNKNIIVINSALNKNCLKFLSLEFVDEIINFMCITKKITKRYEPIVRNNLLFEKVNKD